MDKEKRILKADDDHNMDIKCLACGEGKKIIYLYSFNPTEPIQYGKSIWPSVYECLRCGIKSVYDF